MVSSRSIFQYGIALLSITLILPMVTDAATPPTPPGFNTGGIFADYFLNAVNRSVAPSPSTSTAFDCPQDTYLYGFEGTPGGYMTKRCRSAVYLQAWTVAGNTTTNADFFGTTNAQPLNIRTNNIQRMTVDTAGKIGIDTTTPTVLFDISNRIRAQWDTPIYGIGIAAAGPASGGWARRYGFTTKDGSTRLGGFGGLGNDNGISNWWIGNDYNDYALSLDATTKNAHFTGNIGIGISSPGYLIDTYTPDIWKMRLSGPNGSGSIYIGSGPAYAYIYNNDTTGVKPFYFNAGIYSALGIFNAPSTNLRLQTNDIDRLTILNSNGNVGIGTTTPSAKLEVNGNMKIVTDLSVGGSIRLNPATAANGKILTALDALGNAEWRTPVAPPVGFALINDTWLKSTPDGVNRFKFINNAGSYFSSPAGFEWRNSANSMISSLSDIGNGYYAGGINVANSITTQKFFDSNSARYYVDPDQGSSLHDLVLDGTLKIANGSQGAGKILTSDASGNASWTGITIPASLPVGVAGGTLYSNGTNWLASTNIYNNNGNVGIGTSTPGAKLDVTSGISEVAQFSSTTPNALINIYGAGVRKAYISSTGGSLSINNTQNGSVFLGSKGLHFFTVTSDGKIGIGTETPEASLDIDGDIQIRGGSPGVGKVLTSDANGLASWQPLPPSGGGSGVSRGSIGSGLPAGYVEKDWNLDEDIYTAWGGPRTDTCGGGDTEYVCGASELKNCVDRVDRGPVCHDECGGGEAGGCTRVCSTIVESRNIQCVKATILAKLGNSCSGNVPVCSDDARCSLVQGSPSSNNQGWVQGAGSCGYTCIHGYSGVNCDIPPCETIAIYNRGMPGYGGSVPFAPVNPKNTQIYSSATFKYSWDGVQFAMCDTSATTADKELWIPGKLSTRNNSLRPLPNVGGIYTNAFGYYIYNTPGNYRYANPFAAPPPSDPGCSDGSCGG